MREVIFYLAMIIEIAYVFMSQVPKKLENKYLLIGTAFICASDFTYHIGYNAINMSVFALSGTIARAFEKITLKMIQMKLKCHILTRQLHM